MLQTNWAKMLIMGVEVSTKGQHEGKGVGFMSSASCLQAFIKQASSTGVRQLGKVISGINHTEWLTE